MKCYHNGSPPCRGCLKAGTTGDCVLSGPVLKKKKSSVVLVETPRFPSQEAGILTLLLSSPGTLDKRKAELGSPERPPSRPSQWIKTDDDGNAGGGGLPGQLDANLISRSRRAAHVFVAHFPEIGFLHMPSFLQELNQLEDSRAKHDRPRSSSRGASVTVLCSAIVALCAPLMQEDCDAEGYASFARNSILGADLPDLRVVQTLLVLAMYDWGNGRGYRAWAYSGMSLPKSLSLF